VLIVQYQAHLLIKQIIESSQPMEMPDTTITRQSIQALILDMDGVLWRGSEPIGDLRSIFDKISQLGWKVIFATNNATRTIQQYVDVLASFGIQAQPWQIINSAIAVTHYLCQQHPHGGPVYIVGEQGVIEACDQAGFYQSENSVIAVIAGMDRQVTYEKLKIATILIRSGVPFIGTNPDVTFPTPYGLVPGAGSILAAITAATGVDPIIAGKPEPTMYQIALNRLKITPESALVVGDRPETDIAGAQQIGCHTALVLSGVTDAKQAASWQPAPDIIEADLASVIDHFIPD
jgi:4-nitrophenyl phosphatase